MKTPHAKYSCLVSPLLFLFLIRTYIPSLYFSIYLCAVRTHPPHPPGMRPLFFHLPTPYHSAMLWVCVVFTLGFFTPATVAIEATVCDCTTPAHMGILQFSDENFRPEEDLVSALPVTYVVNTERRADTKFPGQLECQNVRSCTKATGTTINK